MVIAPLRPRGGQSVHIEGVWDLIIAHPPCTYLSNVATRQFSLKCRTPEQVVDRWQERAKAAVLFMQMMLSNAKMRKNAGKPAFFLCACCFVRTVWLRRTERMQSLSP